MHISLSLYIYIYIYTYIYIYILDPIEDAAGWLELQAVLIWRNIKSPNQLDWVWKMFESPRASVPVILPTCPFDEKSPHQLDRTRYLKTPGYGIRWRNRDYYICNIDYDINIYVYIPYMIIIYVYTETYITILLYINHTLLYYYHY